MNEDQQKLEFQAGLSEVLPKLAYESDNEKRLALSGFESKFFDTYEIDEEGQVTDKATGEVRRDKLLNPMTPTQVVQELAQSLLRLSADAKALGVANGLPAINSIEDLDSYLGEKYGVIGGPAWADERSKLREEMGL